MIEDPIYSNMILEDYKHSVKWKRLHKIINTDIELKLQQVREKELQSISKGELFNFIPKRSTSVRLKKLNSKINGKFIFKYNLESVKKFKGESDEKYENIFGEKKK